MKHYIIRRKSDGQLLFRGTYRHEHEGFEVFCELDPEVQWARGMETLEVIEVSIDWVGNGN